MAAFCASKQTEKDMKHPCPGVAFHMSGPNAEDEWVTHPESLRAQTLMIRMEVLTPLVQHERVGTVGTSPPRSEHVVFNSSEIDDVRDQCGLGIRMPPPAPGEV